MDPVRESSFYQSKLIDSGGGRPCLVVVTDKFSIQGWRISSLNQPCAEAVVNSRADGLKVTKTQQKNVNKTALSTAEHGRRKIGAEGVPKNFILKEKM